jgi:hypothetical protein
VNFQALADGEKRLLLAFLGTLAVADVDGRGFVVAGRQSGAHAGIHAAAEQDDCTGSVQVWHSELLIVDC